MSLIDYLLNILPVKYKKTIAKIVKPIAIGLNDIRDIKRVTFQNE